jgi:hypothetical protein
MAFLEIRCETVDLNLLAQDGFSGGSYEHGKETYGSIRGKGNS